MNKTYQYMTITGRWGTIDKEASKLGREGWRLADVAVSKSHKRKGKEFLVVTMEKTATKGKSKSLSNRGWGR